MTELERDLLEALEQALAHIDDMEGPIIIKEDIRPALRQVAKRAKAAPAGGEVAGADKHAKFLADLAEVLGRAPYELDEALALEQVRGIVSQAERASALEDELDAKIARLELVIERARVMLETAE